MPADADIRADRRIRRLMLFGIVVIALALRIWGMGFGLPQKVHPDEPLLAERAIDAVATGNFKPGFYHWPNFIIYLLYFEYLFVYFIGHLFGVYSGVKAIFQSFYADPTFYFRLGRMTSTIFCLGGMLCMYLVAKKVAGGAAGLAATALMGFNALFIQHSRYITPDVPAACMMIYVWYCLLDYVGSGKLRILYAAAFVGGVAASTKYNAALLLVPILIAAASAVQHRPSGDVPRLSRRIGVYISACILLFALGFFLFTPYSLLDAGEFWRQLKVQVSHQWMGHVGMEAKDSSLLSMAGYFFSPYGIPLLLLTLASLPVVSKPLPWGLILLSFPVLYLISVAGWVVWTERYIIFLLPVCFLAAGAAIGLIAQLLAPRRRELAAVILALLISVPSIVQAARHASIISRPHTRVLSLQWIEANIPSGSRLFIELGGPEPYHTDYVSVYGLDVAPVYDYPEPMIWLDAYSAREEPLVRLRKLQPSPQYIVSSSYTHDRYFDPDMQAKYPDLVKPWIEYYEFIDSRCELIAEFYPGANSSGPWIKIYKLPEGVSH